MSTRPWMPIYWGNYHADTMHLTTLEHGAYFLLIGHYWTHGGLPDNDQQLANITGLRVLGDWLKIKPTMQAFFYDGWKHKRIEAELKRHTEIYAKRLAASEKGNAVLAMKRFRKHN